MQAAERPEECGQAECLIEQVGQVGAEYPDQVVDLLWMKIVVEGGVVIAVAAETEQQKNPQGQPDQAEDLFAHTIVSRNCWGLLAHR